MRFQLQHLVAHPLQLLILLRDAVARLRSVPIVLVLAERPPGGVNGIDDRIHHPILAQIVGHLLVPRIPLNLYQVLRDATAAVEYMAVRLGAPQRSYPVTARCHVLVKLRHKEVRCTHPGRSRLDLALYVLLQLPEIQKVQPRLVVLRSLELGNPGLLVE